MAQADFVKSDGAVVVTARSENPLLKEEKRMKAVKYNDELVFDAQSQIGASSQASIIDNNFRNKITCAYDCCIKVQNE